MVLFFLDGKLIFMEFIIFLASLDGGAKPNSPSKRLWYDVDRSQRNTPFKKRRLFDRSSVVTYDGGISCESVSNSPEKGVDDGKNASAGKLHEGLFSLLYNIFSVISYCLLVIPVLAKSIL